MLRMTAFLALTTPFSPEAITFHTCIPNTQFLVNGRLCRCDLTGRWTEENCQYGLRKPCIYGQIIWHGCNQCKCNNNGELQCTDIYCNNNILNTRRQSASIGNWCIPLKYYRVNCSICVCPASGQTSEAQCTIDNSCLLNQQSQTNVFKNVYDTSCIPNVMYVFTCLQCLCSGNGKFLIENCYDVCQSRSQLSSSQRCKPDTFYRRDCNVCQCPQNGVPDKTLCTNTSCDINSSNHYLVSLNKIQDTCVPYTFTKPQCYLCDCNLNGTINENSCLPTNCTIHMKLINANSSVTCDPEEVVSVCMECFCLRNGSPNKKYCTKACDHESKLNVIEKVLQEKNQSQNLIKLSDLQTELVQKPCMPSSVYFEEGKYCICVNDSSEHKFCKKFTKTEETNSYKTSLENEVNFNANIPCQPNTFVEFDCNTCYCSKSGKIDPKWCTYDDCKAKRLVQESHKLPIRLTEKNLSDKCNPGSILKEKCNYCICPDSGLSKERACTKNYCSDAKVIENIVKFTCEPLAYYEVDCNVCYCPSDGLKNVARCTKNLCDKNFLRSDTCSPGQLFSEQCNVCLCPPNGNKIDKVCTNHTCPEIAKWSNFKLSEKLFEDRISSDTKRSLDLCFPGEQFMIGCKHCLCPETGLKVHAECDISQCNEQKLFSLSFDAQNRRHLQESPHVRIRRESSCIKYNVSQHQRECTPGSMYIVRCKQCICPYMGNIVYFCRPLPKDVYCEQPFPNVQYEPMGRRGIILKDSETDIKPVNGLYQQSYTKYKCNKVGNIMDRCFICECNENNLLIEENCFKSEDETCTDAKPTFLIDNKLIVN